jgi:hypothetical protein
MNTESGWQSTTSSVEDWGEVEREQALRIRGIDFANSLENEYARLERKHQNSSSRLLHFFQRHTAVERILWLLNIIIISLS